MYQKVVIFQLNWIYMYGKNQLLDMYTNYYSLTTKDDTSLVLLDKLIN